MPRLEVAQRAAETGQDVLAAPPVVDGGETRSEVADGVQNESGWRAIAGE